jgi:hypothetical protein
MMLETEPSHIQRLRVVVVVHLHIRGRTRLAWFGLENTLAAVMPGELAGALLRALLGCEWITAQVAPDPHFDGVTGTANRPLGIRSRTTTPATSRCGFPTHTANCETTRAGHHYYW